MSTGEDREQWREPTPEGREPSEEELRAANARGHEASFVGRAAADALV